MSTSCSPTRPARSTVGRIDYMRAVPAGVGAATADGVDQVVRWGLLSTETIGADAPAVGGNPLDSAFWESPAAAIAAVRCLPAIRGSDCCRSTMNGGWSRLSSRTRAGQFTLVTKGAPEIVLDRCVDVPASARDALAAEFAAGNRVVAVASRPATWSAQRAPLTSDDERGLSLLGLLVFLDPPKDGAADALRRLANLGIAVKVVTGDNAAVAVKVCHDLGLLRRAGAHRRRSRCA